MAQKSPTRAPEKAVRAVLAPLALAQFICSFAGSNMNVMINDISEDLNTTVQGVQIAITIFLLVMAALMIPGGKLTDRFGRKRCFMVGLVLYGIGALISAVAPNLGILIIGNSILEGVGTALLIPPVYILTTLLFTEMTTPGPGVRRHQRAGWGRCRRWTTDRRPDHLRHQLAGGLRLPGPDHRVDHLLARRITDPLPADPASPFDTVGAILSAVGLVLIVTGILAADTNGWLMIALIVAGAWCPDVVLRQCARQGAQRSRAAAVHRTVPQPDVEPRPGHPEPAVAVADGDVLRRRCVPAGGPWLRRDPDRSHLHRGNRRAARLLPGRGAARPAVRPADPDPGWFCRHHRGHRAYCCSWQAVPRACGPSRLDCC